MPSVRTLIPAALLLLCASPALAQKEFGFDNRKPSGQPYLKPEESVARMKVADGFEVKLFAAEPMVVNPVAMTVDEKGRVWVIECFEYPKRTAKGKMPRDRIVILEDTKGTGVADKRTVFAEGKDFPVPFDLATGLEVGNGGVYVGAPPYLFFIENKNDKPGKFEILLKGFGSQDTHETLNTFQWGPDGRLYGLHGVFTHSEVKPEQADGPATRLNAGVWRYDTRAKKFEIFAEGTSNPWGMDWRNTDGQFILCCCVIPHLYHIVPGGIYKRQAGQSFNPYAFGEIKEICDHTFHKESGWAHAGLISLDTPLMPEKYRNSVIFGSIHGCSLKQNILKKNGSTYTASRGDDFLVSGDKNFRPINLRWGHNGEIYCIDWHDQNPCHQAGADSWDYEHGRVYRIQPKGLVTKKAEDWGRKSRAELINMLFDDNPYISRTCLRLLGEKKFDWSDIAQNPVIAKWAARGDLRAFWTILSVAERGSGEYQPKNIPSAVRSWMVRSCADWTPVTASRTLADLAVAAKDESEVTVRREMANAALQLHGKKNLDPFRKNDKPLDASTLLRALLQHKEDAQDPVIPLMLWLAYEKQIGKGRTELEWLYDNCAGNPLVTDFILPRAMRRLAAENRPGDLKACVSFVVGIEDVRAQRMALEGLTIGLKGRQVDAPSNWKAAYAELSTHADADVRKLAQGLAINFRDLAVARAALAVARDRAKTPAERAEALRALGLARIDEARPALLEIATADKTVELRVEALRALNGYDGPDIAREVLKGWKEFPPAVRAEAVSLLASRKEWARELLNAVGDKRVPRTDLTDNTVLRILTFKDAKLNTRVKEVWGKIGQGSAELNQLIDRMRGELHAGPASFERGRRVFDNTCAKCHKFEARGHTVGPELDGAGRDIEYLLVNILDPNRVVGAPYFQRVVTTKKGQTFVGLMHAEDKETVTLKSENDALRVIARKDIDTLEVVERSMMPEGLDKNMTVQDFRDLVRYVMASPFICDVEISGKPVSVGVPGRIVLPASKEKQAKAVIRARVEAGEAFATRLLLGGGQALTIRLNGEKVGESTAGKGAAPDQMGVDVRLNKGTNELVIEATYPGDQPAAVFARFLDPNRKIRHPEAKDR